MPEQTPYERAVEAAAQALSDEGGDPGNSIHSWRCEHPDRYGDCTCLRETAHEQMRRAIPHLLADLRARLHEVPQPDLDGDEDSIPIKFVGTGKTLYADAYVDGLEGFVAFAEEWLDRLTEEAADERT